MTQVCAKCETHERRARTSSYCRACHAADMAARRKGTQRAYSTRHSRRDVIENLRDLARDMSEQGRTGAASICLAAIAHLSYEKPMDKGRSVVYSRNKAGRRGVRAPVADPDQINHRRIERG